MTRSAPWRPGDAAVRPPLPRMLWRGVRRCCPWCGDRRAYFTGWFTKRDECVRCAVPWRRSDVGFELGAATVNTVITFGAVVVGLAVSLIVTAPDFAVVEIIVGLVVGAMALPVVVYPISYTLWQALDLAMRPPGPGEFAAPARGTGTAPGMVPGATPGTASGSAPGTTPNDVRRKA